MMRMISEQNKYMLKINLLIMFLLQI
jgi:hypothetical protein